MSLPLEVCVDTIGSAITAENGGAHRIELCSDLRNGGLTPSIGLVQAVRSKVRLQLFVMVRPRGGDSLYTDDEFQVMQTDILQARAHGADGVVLGLLDRHGHIDVDRTRHLVELAAPMQVTFHRAFDMSVDLDESLSRVIETGAHRVLTSGGMQSVEHGAQRVARLVRAAQGKIRIMAGGGIRLGNVHRIAAQTGAPEYHSSLRRKVDGPMVYRNPALRLGPTEEDEFSRYIVLEEDVRRLRRALDSIASQVGESVSP